MSNVRLVQFQKHKDPNGVLCVYEHGRPIPFEIQRVFTILAATADVRGDHAHKKCTQLLVCLSGKIRVTCDDGSTVTQYALDSMDTGLLIPPGVWARQEYMMNGAILMVLCDRVYEAEDYLRDYAEFKEFIGSGR